jgi:hemoglobin
LTRQVWQGNLVIAFTVLEGALDRVRDCGQVEGGSKQVVSAAVLPAERAKITGTKTEHLMQTDQEPPKSLYDRLGGIYSIAVVVDDFIDRVMSDARLNANPAVNEAHHKVPPAGFKYLVTEMVGWATGGPQKYSGRSMADSHRHLNITAQEWESFMDDFQQTLDKFKVLSREQAELKAIVNSTYNDIVIGKTSAH